MPSYDQDINILSKTGEYIRVAAVIIVDAIATPVITQQEVLFDHKNLRSSIGQTIAG